MKFTDADGRDWVLTIDVNAAKTIRRELDIDLLSLHRDAALLERLADDPCLLVDCLSVLLTDAIRERGLESASFARALRQEALDRAADALIGAIVDFFPPAKARALRTLWEKATTLADRLREHQQTLLRQSDDLSSAAIEQMDRSWSETLQSIRGN